VPAELRTEIEGYVGRYPDVRSASIPALHAVQRWHGWCSPTAIEQAACVMRLTPAYLTAVATFYDMFETQPKGEHTVYVCTNISCSMRGGDQIYEAMLSAARRRPALQHPLLRVPGSLRHRAMASVTALRGPRLGGDMPHDHRGSDAGRPPLDATAARHRCRPRPLSERVDRRRDVDLASGPSPRETATGRAQGHVSTHERHRTGTIQLTLHEIDRRLASSTSSPANLRRLRDAQAQR
jgi:hypothetical protein